MPERDFSSVDFTSRQSVLTTARMFEDLGVAAYNGTGDRLSLPEFLTIAGWGADFHPDLQPRPEDIVLLPHKGIDVFETDLPEHLRRMRITHLVIAGMAADLCCEGTGRHAMEEGYDVTFLSDAIGAESIPAYEAAVHLSYPMIANGVLKVDEFLAAIGSDALQAEVRPGDTVFGSDHLEIGTVEDVVRASEATEAYLLVRRGRVFRKRSYVPADAVVKRAGTDVFINVPRLVIGKMPWTEPPSRADGQAKNGPPASEVEKLYGSRSPSVHEKSGRSASSPGPARIDPGADRG